MQQVTPLHKTVRTVFRLKSIPDPHSHIQHIILFIAYLVLEPVYNMIEVII